MARRADPARIEQARYVRYLDAIDEGENVMAARTHAQVERLRTGDDLALSAFGDLLAARRGRRTTARWPRCRALR